MCVCVCKFTDFSEELGFNGELRRERPFGKTVFANSRGNIKSADILVYEGGGGANFLYSLGRVTEIKNGII